MNCTSRAAPASSCGSAAVPGCCAARLPRCSCPLLLRPARRPHPPAPAAAASSDGAGFTNGNALAAEAIASVSASPPSPAPARAQDSSAQQNGAPKPATPAPGAAAGAAAGAAGSSQHEEERQPTTFLGRVKRFFTGSKLDKARLAALGFGAFSAYGVISNINAGILITIAWITVVRTTGLTPLDGGNWSRFLAIYAGLWIGSNFLRPIRLTLALAAAPLFDAAIGAVSNRTGLPRVPAFVVMLMGIAVLTTSALGATIAVLGGFPAGCRMPWQPA